ncbi:MAG: DegT/DnrJ/EryC1/StrS family aminotransferase [Nitrososphaerales archaeon]
MNVPFLDLRRQYDSIREELNNAISSVLEKSNYILGENVRLFEREFSNYVGVKHGIGVGSGTDAIRLTLRALDIGSGDEVLTVPNTAIATALAISAAGAKPAFVDVDPQTYTIDPSKIAEKMSEGVRAVLPVHLLGQPVDIDPVLRFSENKNIFLLEDCAQSHGALYQGAKVGSLGIVGCFSFYPTKNLGAYGDAGMIVTDSDEIAEKVRLLRSLGEVSRDKHVLKGYNSRLDELQAGILRVKLKHLDEWNARRIYLASLYDELLSKSSVITPVVQNNGRHVYHVYAIRSSKRNALKNWLNRYGIGTLVHYPTPIHLEPAYEDLGLSRGSYPISERLSEEILSLPMFPELTEEEVKYVCTSISAFERQN